VDVWIEFIFFNNIQSSFIGMLFGIILGIFPVIAAVANGYLLGFVAETTAEEAGIFILWRIFPHGIFELPALFISLGLGLKIGTFIFKKNKLKTLAIYLLKSIKVFFYIVVPLLIIAALIEGSLIFLF
jgi:stage II sporulation protein M